MTILRPAVRTVTSALAAPARVVLVLIMVMALAACAPGSSTSDSADSEPSTTAPTPLLGSAGLRQQGLDVVAQLLADDTEGVLDNATAKMNSRRQNQQGVGYGRGAQLRPLCLPHRAGADILR